MTDEVGSEHAPSVGVEDIGLVCKNGAGSTMIKAGDNH